MTGWDRRENGPRPVTEPASEQQPPGAPEPSPAEEQAPVTGDDRVDAVLASLSDLDDRPVAEHVAAFESAHDRLRDALARAGDDSATG
jgi:hypothetical protein